MRQRRWTLGALLLASALGGCEGGAADLAPDEPVEATAQTGATLAVTADPVLRPDADSSVRRVLANLTHGWDVRLHVGATLVNLDRSLIHFNQDELERRLGNGVLRSAKLRVTIEAMDPLFHDGALLAVHDLKRSWNESGVTWNCPNDTSPFDVSTNCDVNGPWNMAGPNSPAWNTTAITSQALHRGQTGVVELDITDEVKRWLADETTNNGVLLRLANDPIDAWVNFYSSESTNGPELVLDVDDRYVECESGRSDNLALRTDTFVNEAAPHARGSTATTLRSGTSPKKQITLLSFPPAQLAALTHLKHREIAKVELVLPVTSTSAATGKVEAHAMARFYNDLNATWGCANETSTGTCAATDVWSFTGATPPYVAQTAAVHDGALTAGTDLHLDITRDFVRMLDAPNPTLAWAILSTPELGFASKESSTGGAHLEITVGESCTSTRAGNTKDALGALSDKDRPVVSLVTFTTQAVLCRVAQGHRETDLEQKAYALLQAHAASTQALADTLAYIGEHCSDADFPSAADRATLLGPLAASDPLTQPLRPLDRKFPIDAMASEVPSPRLRTNMCVAGVTAAPTDVTVGVDIMDRTPPVVLFAPTPTPSADLGNQPIYKPSGRPVLVGVVPRHEDPRNNNSPIVGYPALVQNYLNVRSAGDGDHHGDGLDGYGYDTGITCDAQHVCPKEQGLICGATLGRYPDDHCFAFPIVQEDDVLPLIGYNFWDQSDAKLVWTRIGGTWKQVTGLGIEGVQNNESVGDEGCKVGTKVSDDLEPSRLYSRNAARSVESHDVAPFAVPADSAGFFYKVQMFNKNGNYHTMHTDDPLSGKNPGRTLHVCWQECLSDPDTAGCPRICTSATDTNCIHGTCAFEPAQTCPKDGLAPDGSCRANEWTSAPRPLSACLSGAAVPSETAKCAETPEWFASTLASNRREPFIVYVEARRPVYKVTTRLDRVKSIEESGGDFWGSDEFQSVTVSTVIPIDGSDPKVTMMSYDNEFDEDQVRNPQKSMITVLPSSATQVFNVSLVENDEGIRKFLTALEATIGVTHVIAGAVVGAYYGGPAGAAQGAGAGAAIGAAEAGAIEAAFRTNAKNDNMGTGAWIASFWDYFRRVADSRKENFLSAHIDTSTGPMVTPSGVHPFGKQKHRLTHPMRLSPPTTCECGSGCAVNSCGSGQACYANLCVDNFVSCAASDPFCTSGFREIRQFDTRAKHAGAEYRLEYLNVATACNPVVGTVNACPR